MVHTKIAIQCLQFIFAFVILINKTMKIVRRKNRFLSKMAKCHKLILSLNSLETGPIG